MLIDLNLIMHKFKELWNLENIEPNIEINKLPEYLLSELTYNNYVAN